MKSRFRADVQGLRAIAVAAVLLSHAGVPGVDGGYVGVDVFFVISGFLITGQLLGRLSEQGRIGFADFYARRARRILPASFTVLALTIAGVLVCVPPALRPQSFSDAVAVALYVPNYVLAIRGTDYLADTAPSVFQHYWSLGVEEQFYLLWPALLLGLWALAHRVRRRRVLVGAAMAVVIAVSLAIEVALTGPSQPWAFFSLWTRAWELASGGLLAIGAPLLGRVLRPAVSAVLGWAGLAAIVAACALFGSDTSFPGIAAVLPVAGAAALIAAGCVPVRWGPGPLLSTRPFQFVGAISYSLYLVHWPLLQLTQARVGYESPLPLWATCLLAAVAVPIAWAMYRFVEQPMRRMRRLAAARPQRSLLAAGAGSAVLACLAVTALSGASSTRMYVDEAVPHTAPTAPPVGTPFVPSNLEPSLAAAKDDNAELYDDGCELGFSESTPKPCSFGKDGAPRIVLFGDSQAAQWAPALEKIAKQSGYQLVTQTKSACASVLEDHVRDGAPYPSCDQWRDAVLRELAADPPEVLVLADYEGEELPDGSSTKQQWSQGLAATIVAVPAQTRIVLLSDTPDFGTSPVDCLSAHLDDTAACAREASLAFKKPVSEAVREAADSTRAEFVDMTDYFCARTCPPIIGGRLVYRDSHHITATFSAALAPALKRRLAPYLP
ncbi:acyltransferase family protein [Gryllotalpicola ginsengisoli]|uniref:acyltransferase family protein n=1 Tax=Gryllotalpicola ginsengisoli TaxID=444608 RepID=UPI0003B3883A|nr:acyltransferase family protein [Gryllotalpicola ginsengisoli]